MQPAPPELLQALLEAVKLKGENKHSRAAQFARTAYALACEHLPVEHSDRKASARLLGLLLLNLNQKAEGERLLRESGDVGSGRVSARTTEASLLMQQGRFQEAIDLATETLELASEEFGVKSREAVLAAAVTGQIYEQMGDLEQAHLLFNHIVNLRRQGGHEPELLVHSLLDLARLYLRCDQIDRCEPLYREALELQGGAEDLGMAVTLNQYGAVCRRLGRIPEAIEHLERSLQMRRSILGADHPQVATALHGLVAVYMELEEYQKADEALTQAWRISDRALGPGHPKTLQYLTERGLNLMGMGKHRAEEGLGLVRRASQLSLDLPPSEPHRRQIAQFLDMAEQLWAKMSADQG